MEDKVVQDMIERLVRIETKLDNYESLREKADSIIEYMKTELDELKARLEKLEA